MSATLQFGPFNLIRPLGSGGMGMVWRAVHRTQKYPVAIKVMTAKRAREERFLNSFREEVRAVARLNHPNVIRVFDSGEVSEEAAQMTDGQMIPGSPYLVMELAESTLAHVEQEKLSWPHIRAILMHILDALAHSHARGLIHRDLKPDNILFIPQAQDAQLKLSDFGLAHAMYTAGHLEAEDHTVSGTPRYMAPEQITGQVREQGPWTDLYTLGCLAYWLTTGQPPFSAETIDEVLRSHLTRPRPHLTPNLQLPDGFAAWARRLIATKPADRFRRAADAALELARLGGEAPTETMSFTTRTSDGEEMDMTIVDELEETHILHETLAGVPKLGDARSEVLVDTVPPLPHTWRHQRQASPMKLVGVGLGLYGLREVPLVGRYQQRDLLWTAMADATDTSRPHAVLLTGPAGIGKTRLARWLAERTHEVGAANILHASHSPISGPAHGLGRMFSNFLGCTGVGAGKILERVRDFYSRDEALDDDALHQCMALTALLARAADPHFDESKARIRFRKPEERFIVWKRLLERLGRDRPLLMILDDVHWGSSTLQFLRFLFDESPSSELPLLVVMTARLDAIDAYPLARELLREFEKQPLVRHLELEPLDDEIHNELIHNLLGLETQLAAEVADRTAGNPLFAIQLVGDWVERGVLEFGDQGFFLPEGEEAPLPDDVHQLLVQRLEQLVGQSVDDPPNPLLLALELAAVLGREVDHREWRHLCTLATIEVPATLLDDMASQSLASIDEQGWTFVHGALRETLERVAERHHRLEQHHRLCAEMLRDRYDESNTALAPRLARHLLQAHQYEAALDPLLLGVRHYSLACDFEAASGFFDLFVETKERLNIDDDDRRTVRGWLDQAYMFNRQMRVDRADELLERCEQTCRRHGWNDLLAETLLDHASNSRVRSHLEPGARNAREALELFEELEDPHGRARTLLELGWNHKWQGEFRKACRLFEGAEPLLLELGEDIHHARCLHGLASVHTSLGNYERASSVAQRSLEKFEALGDVRGVSHCYTSMGENCRYRGDLAGAEQYYQKAYEMGERLGVNRDLVYGFNLGITLLARHKFEEALPYMRESLRRARAFDRPGYLGLTHAALASCQAGLSNWEAFDVHFAAATRALDDSSFVERDLALALEWAGDFATADGQLQRARNAYEAALDQWAEVGDESRIKAIRKRLSANVAQ